MVVVEFTFIGLEGDRLLERGTRKALSGFVKKFLAR